MTKTPTLSELKKKQALQARIKSWMPRKINKTNKKIYGTAHHQRAERLMG